VASGPEKASRVATARRCGLVERGQKVQRKRTSAGRSVTATTGFGEPQLVRDVLQAGALHALLQKQVPGDLLNPLSGV
jgi:hypothetical protein